MDLLSDSNLFSLTQLLVKQKIKDTLSRKLDELKVQIGKVLTDEEIAIAGFNLARVIDQLGQTQMEINLRVFPMKKGRSKKETHSDVRCMARIGLGTQCTRSRGTESDFCKSHAVVLPYGRFDGPLEQKTIKPMASHAQKHKLEDLDIDSYVQASIVQIDDDCLIQDEYGMLYRNDQSNQIIGRATDGGIEWY